MPARPRTLRALTAFVLIAAALGACSDLTAGDGHEEPDIASVMISRGQDTVVLGTGGQAGTMALLASEPNAIAVRVLDAHGEDDPAVIEHADEYEIRIITPSGTSRFTGTNSGYPYAGTIDPGSTTGTNIYYVHVYSVEHGHVEFTGLLAVTVATAP